MRLCHSTPIDLSSARRPSFSRPGGHIYRLIGISTAARRRGSILRRPMPKSRAAAVRAQRPPAGHPQPTEQGHCKMCGRRERTADLESGAKTWRPDLEPGITKSATCAQAGDQENRQYATTFCLKPASHIDGVFGRVVFTDARDAYATALLGGTPAVAHLHGSTWRIEHLVKPPGKASNIYGVAASEPNNVVGRGGGLSGWKRRTLTSPHRALGRTPVADHPNTAPTHPGDRAPKRASPVFGLVERISPLDRADAVRYYRLSGGTAG